MNISVKNELEKSLNQWATCFLKIENEYYYKKYDHGDVVLLNTIGESIFALRSFHSLLITHIKKINGIKQTIRYIKFFDDLIASKVKLFFFREAAVENLNGPYTDVNLSILNTGKELIDKVIKGSPGSISDINNSLYKHFYTCSLLYAFLYEPENNQGTFLHFGYIKEKYELISEQIRRLLKNYAEARSSIQNIRMVGTYMFPIIAACYVENKAIEIKKIKIPDCYKDLIHSYTKEKKIEPLTYHFADIMWKVDSIIHNKNECLDASDRAMCEERIIQMIQEFATDYFNLADNVYQEGTIPYKKLFELETNFIEKIHSDILYIDDYNVVTSKMNLLSHTINNDLRSEKGEPTIESKLEIGASFQEITSIFEQLKISKVKNYKIETLIEILDKKQLLSLLINYAFLLPRNISPKTAFVGFYSSGVFLGHIVNFVNRINRPVWLFKAKPHIATQPIHHDSEGKKQFNDIIAFDECFKTGFTYSLYKSYVYRNFPISKPNVSIYSLFDYTDFQKMEAIKESKAYALVILNGSHYPTNVDEYKNNSVINFGIYEEEKSGLISDGILEGNNDITDTIKDLISDLAHDKRLSYEAERGALRINLTYLLSNTRLIFSVCNKFSEKISEKISETGKKSAFFVAPTPEGKAIALVTAFLLRLEDKKVFFHKKGEEQELNRDDVLIVGVDLSVITGFTLSRRYGLYIDQYDKGSPDDEEIDLEKNRLDSFDLICTIFTNQKNKNNIFAIYSSEYQ